MQISLGKLAESVIHENSSMTQIFLVQIGFQNLLTMKVTQDMQQHSYIHYTT